MASYNFPYMDWRQSADKAPSDWEMTLASAIEAAFSNGHYELDALVEALNGSRVRPRKGGNWTNEVFTSTMRELGA